MVIEPPSGPDSRASMAVSPIYLESLKTYEQFATSDSLFQTAVTKFGLRGLLGARPIESLKRSVLKVGLLRNTRILEISATLSDPKRAQALAQFIAESTMEMNRSLLSAGDRDMQRGMEQEERDLREQLQAADARWTELMAREPVSGLQAEGENAIELRASLEQQLSSADLETADATDQLAHAPPAEKGSVERLAATIRARRDQISRQLETVSREERERENLISLRLAHREQLEDSRKATETQLAAVERQLREARGTASYRGERLEIIDPGIVPERPSSPNLPLNAAAAFLLGIILPVSWLTVQMSYRDMGQARPVAPVPYDRPSRRRAGGDG
jgi:capsule polysaccharide export protein KpsE/RkpR